MNKKISIGAAATLIIVSVALTFSVTMVIAMRQFNYNMNNVNQRQAAFDYITEVEKTVRNHFVGTINEEQLRTSLAEGYLDGIGDPYADYLTASEFKNETERLSGKLTGLGLVILQQADGAIVISAVHKNSAADKAGIQKGDVITLLDGTAASAIGFADVSKKISNAEKLMITVNRGTDSIAFEISPSTYAVISVESRLIGTTGYIRISGFFSDTSKQFIEAFTSLESQGAQNYIFDVRYNQGGTIKAAEEMISYLVPRGTYAYSTGMSGAVTNLVSEGTFAINKPSVTLVNESTSGEAELFAGVLQDFKKTTVVGVQTAGRGMIQEFFSIKDGSAIQLSVASLSLVNGGALHGVGVTPNVVSGLTSEQENRFAFLDETNDPQLIAALTTIKGGAVTNTTSTTTSATAGTTTAK